MDISSKRFKIWTDPNGAGLFARDSDAPHHCHAIDAADVPTAHAMAMMSESAFDKVIFDLIYNQGE